MILKEWDDGKYTGRIIKKEIVYMLDDNSGYVLARCAVMSIKQSTSQVQVEESQISDKYCLTNLIYYDIMKL